MKRIITDSKRIAQFVHDTMGHVGATDYTAIGLEDDGKIVAGVLYDNYNGASVNTHIAANNSKRWMNREYLHFIFWYPFEQMKVKRLTALVAENNTDSRNFVKKLGFDLEATLQDADPDGDLLVYRMFRDQCKWLNMRVKYASL